MKGPNEKERKNKGGEEEMVHTHLCEEDERCVVRCCGRRRKGKEKTLKTHQTLKRPKRNKRNRGRNTTHKKKLNSMHTYNFKKTKTVPFKAEKTIIYDESCREQGKQWFNRTRVRERDVKKKERNAKKKRAYWEAKHSKQN